MSFSWVALLLFAAAGFLAGGTYSLWKSSRVVAAALGVGAVLAAGGGILWLID